MLYSTFHNHRLVFIFIYLTGCGDTIDLSGKIYIVSCVSYLYKYESGGFKVFKKKLKVEKAKTSYSDVANEDAIPYLQ